MGDRGTVYRGYGPGSTAGEHLVVVEQGRDLARPLRHVVKHSPDGFSWGYAGSGPAELARCILIDALDAEPDCGECGGKGCLLCDGGYTVPGPGMYQGFKFEAIAVLPADCDWQMDQADVLAWVVEYRSRMGAV